MSIADIVDRKERPAYVRFETRPIEVKAESIKQGRYVAKDVDFAIITPPYTKDTVIFEVNEWFQKMTDDVRNNRMPEEWAVNYRKAYDAWKSGQEIPLEGTPVKGWGLASPAQQDTLLRMNIRTVEDVALMNDDALRRFGMGAMEMKNKALAYLAQADTGKAAAKMAELEGENALLKANLSSATETIQSLSARLEALEGMVKNPGVVTRRQEIEPSEIIPEEESISAEMIEAYKAKFGKPPHHRMKPETVRRELGM